MGNSQPKHHGAGDRKRPRDDEAAGRAEVEPLGPLARFAATSCADRVALARELRGAVERLHAQGLVTSRPCLNTAVVYAADGRLGVELADAGLPDPGTDADWQGYAHAVLWLFGTPAAEKQDGWASALLRQRWSRDEEEGRAEAARCAQSDPHVARLVEWARDRAEEEAPPVLPA